MQLRLRLWQKVSFLILIPAVFCLNSSFATYQAYLRSKAMLDSFEASQNTLTEFNSEIGPIMDTLLAITVSGNMLLSNHDEIQYSELANKLRKSLEITRETANVRPEAVEIAKDYKSLVAEMLRLLRRSQDLFNDAAVKPSQRLSLLKIEIDRCRVDAQSISKRIAQVEHELQGDVSEFEKVRDATIFSIIWGLLVSAAFAVGIAYIFFRTVPRRLESVVLTAEQIALGKVVPAQSTSEADFKPLYDALREASLRIHETNETEAAILNQTADVICSTDLHLRFTSAPTSVERHWGYEPGELLGRSILTLVDSKGHAPWRALIESKEVARGVDFETTFQCKNGSIRNIAWTITISKDGTNYICLAHDVTERRQIEGAKRRLLATVSHDVRSPLASVSATFSLVEAGAFGALPDGSAAGLNRAQFAIDSLLQQIQDLLLIERLESGRIAINASAVSAIDVCNISAGAMENLSHQVKVTGKDSLVYGDEDRLIQIVECLGKELIQNASPGAVHPQTTTTKPKAISISVSSEQQEFITFTVSLESDMENRPLTKSTDSLRMTLAKKLVAAHKGRLFQQTEANTTGLLISFDIPRFIDADEPEEVE